MSTSPMTTPSPTARASVRANNPAGDAVEIHDGEIWMWSGGTFGPVSRMSAVAEAAYQRTSPFATARRKAEALIAALRETMQ